MGIADIVIAAVILAGAAFLLCHSIRKGKDHCRGCSGNGNCGGKQGKKNKSFKQRRNRTWLFQ